MSRVPGHVLVALIVSACSDAPAAGGNPDAPSAPGSLEVALETVRARNGVPSLGAMILFERDIVESATVGVRAVGFTETVTTDDRWHIGSITKAMTATLAGVLVEDGVVAWETTVGETFPDLVGDMRAEYTHVQLDELLSHTGGLATDVTRAPSWLTLRTSPDPLPVQRRQFARELLRLAPEAARGDHLYSNAGYVVAGAMLEEVTGESWETLMQREIFEPLGMPSTGFGPPGQAGARDDPWAHTPDGSAWRALEPGPDADNPAALGPAGTVHTTFADYANYLTAHMSGAGGMGGLVALETFAKLHTAAPGTEYALGWNVGTRDWADGRTLSHAGSNTLWFAVVWIAPERDLAMLAVTNAGGETAFQAVDEAIGVLIGRFETRFGL